MHRPLFCGSFWGENERKRELWGWDERQKGLWLKNGEM